MLSLLRGGDEGTCGHQAAWGLPSGGQASLSRQQRAPPTPLAVTLSSKIPITRAGGSRGCLPPKHACQCASSSAGFPPGSCIPTLLPHPLLRPEQNGPATRRAVSTFPAAHPDPACPRHDPHHPNPGT